MGDGRTSMTRSALSLVLAAVLLQAPAGRAAQLDKESCGKLKGEQVQLEKEGARSNLAKGPDWVKANLAPEKLDQVRRLIEVDEQLLFRCGGRPLVVLPSDPDAAPGEGAPEKPEKPEKSQHDVGKKAAVPVKRATPSPPGKETAREARPAAPPPRGNAPAAGAAREVAKEPPPAGAAPTPEAATPPAPPPTKQDPANVTPAVTAVTPPPTLSPSTKAEEEKKAA